MADYDYTHLVATADRLIGRYGRDAAVRRFAAGSSGDPWHPTGGSHSDHATRAVNVGYESGEIDGATVLSTDRRYLVAAGPLDIVPDAADALVLDPNGTPEVLSVHRFNPLKPAGTVVYWEAQVRE